MFVGTTGTIGLILALILLFQAEPPEDVQIVLPKPETPETKVVDREPEPQPEPQPEPKPEPKPKPEPTVVAKVEPQSEPEFVPTPPPVEDEFDVEVYLLPGPPEKNQGEQFEITGGAKPIIPNDGFNLVSTNWQEADLLNKPSIDPWMELQKLVPLEPYGPRNYVLDPNPGGAVTASFMTTQPRRGTQSLLLPYEMTVINTGGDKIDRVVMQQTLPESMTLRETSAVHGVENRTLRWEYEGLAPKQQWTVPMVVVPTMQGQVKVPTTIDIGRSASAKTLIQRPEIELSLTCEPAAQYKKYHQIAFLMKNTGEVPLNNLVMDIQLTGNLWHRFGQEFEFFHKQLDVGQTHRAFLHVKTEDLGGADLHASLVTDEGAGAGGKCEFVIIGDGEIEPRGIKSPSTDSNSDEFETPQQLPENDPREWREPGSQPVINPKVAPERFDEPSARPVNQPRTLKEAEEQSSRQDASAAKDTDPPTPKETADEFPGFSEFDPLPDTKPKTEKPTKETELVEDSSFDTPLNKSESATDSKPPAEESFDPIETTDDPFSPKKKDDGFFE